MSLLLPILAPLSGGTAFTCAALYLLAAEALNDRAPQAAIAEDHP